MVHDEHCEKKEGHPQCGCEFTRRQLLKSVEQALNVIGQYWMLPRDEWEISHVSPDDSGRTSFISFVRRRAR